MMERTISIAANSTSWSDWLRYTGVGVSLGLLAAIGQSLGLWGGLGERLGGGVRWLNAAVGLVWIPMFAIACRVGVLTARAASTRSGRYTAHGSGTRELESLAPLFTGLGFAGSVAGFLSGFGALEGGHLLEELGTLLSALGTSMISTLVGLGLWAATLSLAAWMPWWTWARCHWKDGDFQVALDDRELGSGAPGLDHLIEAIRGRQPEALCLAFDRDVPREAKVRISNAVWAQRDADLSYREVTLR